MKARDREIRALSERLAADVLALGGRLPAPARGFRLELLVPLGALLGVALLVALQPAARKRALLSFAAQAAGTALQLLVMPAADDPGRAAARPE